MEQRQNLNAVLGLSTKNGPLAQIWLASNMGNLTRNTVLQTNIADTAEEVAKVTGCAEDGSQYPVEHITLRTSGELLHGIVRVYSKQAAFLLTDIKDTLTKISSLFRTNQRLGATISKYSTITRLEFLVLDDTVTERDVLSVPSLDFLNETSSLRNHSIMNDSMDRRMTGAKSYDLSIEVGRRFAGDEELQYNEDSTLNLDFDLGQPNDSKAPLSSSKSWDEGTRQSGDVTAQSNYINMEDDEFLAEGEPEELHLDLGLDTADGDRSIELGRRAEPVEDAHETTDFGFDLDIGKDPINMEEDNESAEELELEGLQADNEPLRKAASSKNPSLVNTHPLQTDRETELSDEVIKSNPDRNLVETGNLQTRSNEEKLTAKRLWSEMAQSMAYLPHSIFNDFMKLQPSKKQRTEDDNQGDVTPEMDISLGMNDDLISDNDAEVPMDHEINEPDLEIAGNIGELPEQTSTQNAEGTLDVMQTQTSSSYSSVSSVESVTQKLASIATATTAKILKETVTDGQSDFSTLLQEYHKHEEGDQEPVTRKDASAVFFSMLSLASADCVDLQQEEAYGEINIITKDNLFQDGITA